MIGKLIEGETFSIDDEPVTVSGICVGMTDDPEDDYPDYIIDHPRYGTVYLNGQSVRVIGE